MCWAITKRKLEIKGTGTSDIGDMNNWWNQLAKNLTEAGVRGLMSGINRQVREFLPNTMNDLFQLIL